MVDMGGRFADDLEELSHKAEAISGDVKEGLQVNWDLDLSLFGVEILIALGAVNLDSPCSTISKLQSTRALHHPQHREHSTPPARK